MMTLLMLLLIMIVDDSAVGQTMKSNESGIVGQDVLLTCNCSNEHNELVWQKGARIVNVHPQDKSIIDDSYKNRTQLFLNSEKRNCSLLIRNISTADAGLYICYALTSAHDKVWSRKLSEVILTVVDDSAVGQTMKSNEIGVVGEDILLSCNCSTKHNELVWQKGERLVNVYPQEESIIDDSYKDRTQLFLNNEKRNCSLLIRNISTADAGLYTCHALASVLNTVWSKKSSEVILTVVDGSAVAQMKKSAKTGFIGQNVLLPCSCTNDSKDLVWQKGERLVNVYPQDKRIIDDSYVDRAQLFLNNEERNCSLLIRNISTADAGLYTCHVLVTDNKNKVLSKVTLTVSTYVPTDQAVSEPEVDQGVHRLRICSVK